MIMVAAGLEPGFLGLPRAPATLSPESVGLSTQLSHRPSFDSACGTTNGGWVWTQSYKGCHDVCSEQGGGVCPKSEVLRN